MAYRAKLTVLKAVYDLLAHQGPLGEALIATLGGEGVEANIWKERGIPDQHGWLIDRSPERMRQFRANENGFRRFQGCLAKFVELGFLPQHGNDVGLDFFHWDLCGTSDPSEADLITVMPLLLKGHAKILVVTVADARTSIVSRDPGAVHQAAARMFGKRWQGLWSSLVATHARVVRECGSYAQPKQAALREVATVLSVVRALQATRKLIPVSLERYIYLSGIRMRTYLFRFEMLDAEPSETTDQRIIEKMAQLLMSPPLSWVSGETVTPVSFRRRSQPRPLPPVPASDKAVGLGAIMTQETKKPPTLKQVADAVKRLRALMKVGVMAEPVIKDISTLIDGLEKARGSVMTPRDMAIAFLTSLRKVFGKEFDAMLEQMKRGDPVSPEATVVPVPATRSSGKKKGRRRPSRQISIEEGDKIRLRILRARALGKENEERAKIAVELGMDPDLSRPCIGALMAFAAPTRCEPFIYRVIADVSSKDEDERANELARLLGVPLAFVRLHGHLMKKSIKTSQQDVAS